MIDGGKAEIGPCYGTIFSLFKEFKAKCGQFNAKCTQKIEPLKKRQEDLLTEFINMGKTIVEEGRQMLLEMGGVETYSAEDPAPAEPEPAKTKTKAQVVPEKIPAKIP